MRTFITTLGGALALGALLLTATQPVAALPAVQQPTAEAAAKPTLAHYYRHHGYYGHRRFYGLYDGYGYDYPRYRSYGYYGGPAISFSIGPRFGYGYGRRGFGW